MKHEGFEFSWYGKPSAKAEIDTSTNSSLAVDTKSINRQSSVDLQNAKTHTLIKGDNLPALKLLKPQLMGQVKMIYIDPPYNTGQKFIYNDQYAIAPAEKTPQLSLQDMAHSSWLNMIYPRLALAKDLLREDGVIFVSIDDHESHHLRIIMDEIFGADNFLATLIWETKRAARGRPPRSLLMTNHEYIICYGKQATKVKFRGIDRDTKQFNNPDLDSRGLWRSESMKATGLQNNHYSIKDPHTGHTFFANWAFSKNRLAQMIEDNLVLFPKTKSGTPRQKKFFHDYLNKTKAAVSMLGWHSTEKATRDLKQLFLGKKIFPFPKPQSLLKYLIDQTCEQDHIILDFFAGSGSTGEAVVSYNIEHDRNNRFILIQAPFPIDRSRPENNDALQLCQNHDRTCDLAEVCQLRLEYVLRNHPDIQLNILKVTNL